MFVKAWNLSEFQQYHFTWPLTFTWPFSDKCGKLALSPKQRADLQGWVRPEQFCDNPQIIYTVSCYSIKQVRGHSLTTCIVWKLFVCNVAHHVMLSNYLNLLWLTFVKIRGYPLLMNWNPPLIWKHLFLGIYKKSW